MRFASCDGVDHTYIRGADGYPSRLLALTHPPARVFVRGHLPPCSPSAVAIVGSRKASARSRALARQFALDLVRHGVTIVSGGAFGVDIAAHQGALAGPGHTIVVLPTPLAQPYPAIHRPIFEQVLEAGGAWLSESTGPIGKWSFCKRNRLIAALCDAVVVVEAGARSGTHYTVEAARSLGRLIFAVPWRVDDQEASGGLSYLRQGAHVALDAGDVLRRLPTFSAQSFSSPPPVALPVLPDEPLSLRARLRHMMQGPGMTLDVLAHTLGAPVPDILKELTLLELDLG